MRKLVSLFTLFFFISFCTILPAPAIANDAKVSFEAVSPLSKGDKAPFEGILFSKDLAAKIEAERKTMITLKLAEIRQKAAVGLVRSELQLKLDVLSSKYSALDEKHKSILKINKEQIRFLQKQYLPTPWYEHPAFVATVSVIVGVGLTIGAAHIVKTVR